MKWIALLLAIWGLVNPANVKAAPAPNLVVNGNFETGDSLGWTVSGSSTGVFSTVAPSWGPHYYYAGIYAANVGNNLFLSGTFSQAISTTAGQTYLFQFSGANTPALDGRFLITGSGGSVLSSGQISSTNKSVFTANGPLVVISFFRENPKYSDWVIVSDVSLQAQAVGYSHPGKYSVKIKETQSFDGVNLSWAYTKRGVARIDSVGHIYCGGADIPMQTGFISDDGSVSFGGVTTFARFKNGLIQFSGTSFEISPPGPVAATGVCTSEVTFTCTGN